MVSGTLGSTPITDGKLRGDEITFTVGNAVYTGRVQGNTIRGTVTGGGGGRLPRRSGSQSQGSRKRSEQA